jgi:hypothetical protein
MPHSMFSVGSGSSLARRHHSLFFASTDAFIAMQIPLLHALRIKRIGKENKIRARPDVLFFIKKERFDGPVCPRYDIRVPIPGAIIDKIVISSAQTIL